MKKWLLTKIVFFCFIEIVLFFRNHTICRTFLYVIILILVHASAVFVKHWHVPTEGPINRSFFTVGQQNSRKRAWCLTYVLFFESTKLSETSKGPPHYIFAGDKDFRQLSAMPLTCFVQQNSCSTAKRSWKLCKTSDESFRKLFLWTRKTIFWHPCEKIYPGGRIFFVLCPNMLKEKFFSF